MSNLNNYFLDATFWVGFASAVFFACMYFLLKKQVSKFLSDKIKNIKSTLDKSAYDKAEAEELVHALKIRDKNLEEEIKQIMNDANLTAQNITNQAKSEIDHMIQEKTSQTMKKLDSYENQIIQQLKISSLEISIDVAKVLIKNNPNVKLSDNVIEKIKTDLDKVN